MDESALQSGSKLFESLVFGARDWAAAAGILAALVALLAVWSYWARANRSGNPLTGLRCLATGLKVLAVAALAFCLLEPMRRSERPLPGANVMAVVVDNSRSMEMRPPGQRATREERFSAKLHSDTPWQSRLAQDFDVRRYAFDDRIRAVENLADLDYQGNHSSLAEAITTLQARFASRPVAGMMLFTDGIATDQLNSVLQGDFSFPIYPVIYDTPTKLKDISIDQTTVNTSSFELAPAGVEATLHATGMAGADIVVRLMDAAGSTLERQTIDCDSDLFQRRVRFQFRPTEPGLQWVRIRAMLASEDKDTVDTESRVEVTTANNLRLLTVDRGGGPYRVLYVAGRPNWEFKFIRRALEEDIEMQLKALVRIAKKEPKFSFRDRGVESANPLKAGFSENEETAEQYDEPVLLRLGVEADELKAGFPSGEEDLYHYHAIVLDDVEASFFTQQQMLLMRQFVAERGGGLMMLGGQESFLGGGYRDTPLGDVLPVYLRGTESSNKDQAIRYRLTREGSLEPWLRLRANQDEEGRRVAEMPDFLTWNTVADVKPGASVMAELQIGDSKEPGLVAQRFGKGRSLALLVGDMWRWSMRRATPETDDLAQSWRQIARWLTNDVPKRVEVSVEPPIGALDPNRIVIQVRDPAYKLLDNATVKLSVTEPDGKEVQASAAQDPRRAGFYVAEYWSQSDGGYRCDIEVTGPDGEELDVVKAGWSAQPSAAEFARVEPDRELLTQLAQKSGGELVPIAELESFVASLPSKKVPITESRVEPLWHRPWLVLFAIGCLCLEWGLRRWKGLP